MDLVTTAPTVVYKCMTTKGEELEINCPSDVPDASMREWMAEPFVSLEMVTPKEYVGNLMDLATTRRGVFVEMKYLTDARTTLIFDIPLAEVVTDYFDELKSRSKGYASMEYKITGYRYGIIVLKRTEEASRLLLPQLHGWGSHSSNPCRKEELIKMDIKINGETAEPLAVVCHRDSAYKIGKQLVDKLKELIPRQMFK